MIIRIVVVFPEPFGPSSPQMLPRGTSKSKPSTAVCLPKRFVTPCKRIAKSFSFISFATIRGEVLGVTPKRYTDWIFTKRQNVAQGIQNWPSVPNRGPIA